MGMCSCSIGWFSESIVQRSVKLEEVSILLRHQSRWHPTHEGAGRGGGWACMVALYRTTYVTPRSNRAVNISARCQGHRLWSDSPLAASHLFQVPPLQWADNAPNKLVSRSGPRWAHVRQIQNYIYLIRVDYFGSSQSRDMLKPKLEHCTMQHVSNCGVVWICGLKISKCSTLCVLIGSSPISHDWLNQFIPALFRYVSFNHLATLPVAVFNGLETLVWL